MDSLAETIKMDPIDLRLKNIPAYSQAREGNPAYTTTGLRQCIEEGAKAFGWKEARGRKSGQQDHIRRGVGMAGALWFAGGGNPPSTVIVKYFSDGSVNLNLGMSDIGTGTKTVMAMVVAEELGVAPELVQIENADTRHDPVRDTERRQQDRADRGADRKGRCPAGEAAAARDGGGGTEDRSARPDARR